MLTQEHTELSEKLSQYEQTRRRAVSFLLSCVRADGSIADGERPRFGFYRVPWAFVVSGETGAAMRVQDWVERACLGPNGGIHGGVEWDPAANQTTNSYAETCIAYGAMLLRRFDIARKMMTFVRQFQDAETGGVFMTREETGAIGRQLLFPTCQFGMSAVISGDVESAIRVGEWLERLWNAQPDLPNRLFTIWSRQDGLAVNVPDGEPQGHYINDARETWQYHYNGGIAAACLTHLFMATGEKRWITLARNFQRFSMQTTEGQFQTKQVCKSAWGAGLIAVATGDSSYLPWLIKMGDWFCGGQEPDGRWSNTAKLDPNPPLAHQIEITAEFVVHMDTLIGALSAISSRSV